MANEVIMEAFNKGDLASLYYFEDFYLKQAKSAKKSWDETLAKHFYEKSDECAELADKVSWMAQAILANNQRKRYE